MWKYEDFKGTAQELFDLLKKDGYELYFYPASEISDYPYVQAYTPEASKRYIKEQRGYAVDVTYDGEEIIEIDSWVSMPDEDEYEDDYEYDDFEARHDGSYLYD